MRRLILPLLALALLAVTILLGAPVLERHRRAAEMRALRAALDSARVVVDSCSASLVDAEAAFQAFNTTLDSLRAHVESFEDPEQGGVPQARYREYLRAFNGYNDLVEEWGPRADTLRAREARCRSLVEQHNALRDSIAAIREEWRGSTALRDGVSSG